MQTLESTNTAEKFDKYLWKLLAQPNGQTGGARQAAVAPQPMHVWMFCQLKKCSPYTDDSKNNHFCVGVGHVGGSGSLQSKIILF